jgi:hypothetical protein
MRRIFPFAGVHPKRLNQSFELQPSERPASEQSNRGTDARDAVGKAFAPRMPTDQTPGFFQSRFGFEAQHFKQTAKPTSFRQAKEANFAECPSDPF